MTADITGYDGIVVSPGVPINTHPIAVRAKQTGVPLISDIEIFAQARASLPQHKVVGITGTNGKSTTTALIRHILEVAGMPALMGGNIGLPIMGRDPLPSGGVYVLELSSYQIDITQSLDCDVAVLLNITPDHLDRYTGFDAYAASKARLFDMQTAGKAAIFGSGDETTRQFAAQLNTRSNGPKVISTSAKVFQDRKTGHRCKAPHNGENAANRDCRGRSAWHWRGAMAQGAGKFRRFAAQNGTARHLRRYIIH